MESFDKFYNSKSKGYSAVVLDDESRGRLLNDPQIKEYINPDHEIIAHHMTIKMGGLVGTPYEARLNQREVLKVTDIGVSDDGNVVAVKVDGESTNKIPHITISVNRKSGAKPKDSNKITNWKELTSPIKLTGMVKEL